MAGLLITQKKQSDLKCTWECLGVVLKLEFVLCVLCAVQDLQVQGFLHVCSAPKKAANNGHHQHAQTCVQCGECWLVGASVSCVRWLRV